jgi:small neutral amino acid transporter SnatA (MarC family)
MLIKFIIVLCLLIIITSLGSALYYLLMDRGKSDRVVKALSWRIGLSLLLFFLLIGAYYLGWITPHAV